MSDVERIFGLIALAPDALLAVSIGEIQGWIESGHSLVAKNEAGEVIGHQGLAYWPGCQMTELRAAYVDPAYRGSGVNTLMKKEMIKRSWEKYPNCPIVGFTEAASKSRGILTRLGFEEVPLDQVPDDFFSICPDTCVKKTEVDCGCKVFILLREKPRA